MLLADATSPPRRMRNTALLALGVSLARRGILAKISIWIAVLTVLGASTAAFVLAQKANAPLEQLPGVTAGALAWGAGILLAFGASIQALKRDRTEGIAALVHTRGSMGRGYLVARVGGLGVLLAIVVGGGTILAGLVATLLAARVGLAARAFEGTLASVAYALVFAATIAPIAVAALGARSRSGGYGWLVLVLIVPDLLEPWTAQIVPYEWRELTSIPSAFGVVRASLMPGSADIAQLLRALVLLSMVVFAALFAVKRTAERLEREGALLP